MRNSNCDRQGRRGRGGRGRRRRGGRDPALAAARSYQVKAIFQNASQIVTGDQVQVSGNPIGTVSDISLTPNGQAQLTLDINNSTYQPLREGTRGDRPPGVAVGDRQPLRRPPPRPGNGAAIPNGGVIPTTDTTSAVDLDQLFNTLDAPDPQGRSRT